MYEYKVMIVRVIDGDTVVGDVDLGFEVTTRRTFRLFGINAPEVHGPSKDVGLVAADYLRQRAEGKVFLLDSHGQEKYGRWLGTFSEEGISLTVNDEMVTTGHAVHWDGHGPRPV